MVFRANADFHVKGIAFVELIYINRPTLGDDAFH